MKRSFVVILGLLFGTLLLAGSPASANHEPGHTTGRPQDPGYPGTTNPNRAPTRERASRTLVAGERIVLESCGFQPNSVATVSFNGESAGTGSAGADGCIQTSVLSEALERGCGRIVVNGVRFDARSGNNAVTVEGVGANSETRTFVHDLALECARSVGAAGTSLPRTGINILRWSGVALALLAVGSITVMIERRRLARRLA